MDDLVDRLHACAKQSEVRYGKPPIEKIGYTDDARLILEAAAEIARLRAEKVELVRLTQCLLDNEPDDVVADGGITVLMVWRKDARALIAKHAGEKADAS